MTQQAATPGTAPRNSSARHRAARHRAARHGKARFTARNGSARENDPTAPRRLRVTVIAVATALGLAVAGCSASPPVSPSVSPSGSPSVSSSPSDAMGDAAGQQMPGHGGAPVTAGGGDANPAAAQLGAPASSASPIGPAAPGRVITVTGTGTVSGTPDTLTLQLGVQTRAETASRALADNNSKAAAVIAVLEKHGVAKKDLQTSQLSIDPTYSSGGTTITGYQVSNMVTATLHDIAAAGAMVDAAQQAAGDAIRLNQIGFSFADDSALRATARADAVKGALAQAKQLAAAAGVTLGAVQSITESPQGSGPQPVYMAAPAAAGAAMPVQPGTQDLTVQVQVVVAIG